MREEVTRLMSLQGIDRQLRELKEALSSVAGRVDQLRLETEGYRAELERLRKDEQQATINRRQLEKDLAEGEANIRNKRMRRNQVRNDKELQALDHEVESLKESNQRLESEVLALMSAEEGRTQRIAELEQLVAASGSNLLEAEKAIAAQVEDLKISISKQRLDRDMMAQNIEPALLARYEMIFSRRAGLAVAEAKEGTCRGCRMRLPPQFFNEIQRHEQVYFCPNCQRILYCEL
ncbi:MAG: C4-type zinc ribbon domain-containing protein [Candidatus Binataceae bacterium]